MKLTGAGKICMLISSLTLCTAIFSKKTKIKMKFLRPTQYLWIR